MITAFFDVVIWVLSIIGSFRVLTFFGLLLLAWRVDAAANAQMEAEREAEAEETRQMRFAEAALGGPSAPPESPASQTAGTDCHGEN